jgi:hypothetical protein
VFDGIAEWRLIDEKGGRLKCLITKVEKEKEFGLPLY